MDTDLSGVGMGKRYLGADASMPIVEDERRLGRHQYGGCGGRADTDDAVSELS